MRVHIDWEEHENVEWHEYKQSRKEHGVKRRLLITTDNFLPRWDGISRVLSEIVPRLQDNYEITIVCPDFGYVTVPGVTIEKVPLISRSVGDYTPARYDPKRIRALVRKSDIVFNQALGPIGIAAILAARRNKTPLVNYIHSVEWELFPKALANPSFRGPLITLMKFVVRYFYNKCSLLILPSENVAEQFSWQGISTPKRVVHLGVDVKKFSPGEKKAARDKLRLPHDAFLIGYHGRIAYEKNLTTLLRAFSRLKIKNKKLVIVGDGVLTLKSRLERHPDVIVTGQQSDVVPWLQAMDLYVQPSLTETTSLSVLEAMACQLPVISSKVGFIQYYIIDGRNGIFFETLNTYDLASKIETLAKDEKLRASVSSNARKTIEKSFRWENTAEKIKEILDEM